MEQIQIRQPKMPAAQSFIQILGTFLATGFIFITSLFSYIKLSSLNINQLKPLAALDLSLKNPTLFIRKEMSKISKFKNLSNYIIFY
ncbi:hypothetical protein CU321_07615 [Prochlorococcus marinus str. MU1412]|nr:hypothetical protein [Prochlorococcus marinus str. MU1412]